MSIQPITPTDVHPPGGAYSHGVSARGQGRTLYISGQVGLTADGILAGDFAEQAAQSWRNIVAILSADGMNVHHLVKLTTYLTDISFARELGRVREPFLEGARPASTLIAVQALVMPDWLIEIEAIAFKND